MKQSEMSEAGDWFDAAEVLVDGSGPPIVLLHSAMASKSQWKDFIAAFRNRHRLIAIDLYGYGSAPSPQHGDVFSLEAEVMRIEEILAATLYSGERYHLVGHSYGGAVALRLALTRPSGIDSLTLFEPTAFHLLDANDMGRAEISRLTADLKTSLSKGDAATAAKLFIEYWSGVGAIGKFRDARRRELIARMPMVMHNSRALFAEPLSTLDYRRLTAPICLVGGVFSPRSVHSVLTVLAYIFDDQCQLHWVPASHMAPITHSAEVNIVIDRFIREVGAKQPILVPWARGFAVS
jgi:pimeloyl-ACP methyl ester carboxylesterase